MFLLAFFGTDRTVHNVTNRSTALIYSVTICEEKAKDCASQGASNINYRTVFNFDVCRLS